MRFVESYSHYKGMDVWAGRALYEWVTDIFEAPGVRLEPGATNNIREHVKRILISEGWALNAKVDPQADLTVFARKNELALQLQTGNISRYAYDLLKLQHLYAKKAIDAAALAVPTKEAAQVLGSNIAHVERICNELAIFDRVITVPLLVVAFE